MGKVYMPLLGQRKRYGSNGALKGVLSAKQVTTVGLTGTETIELPEGMAVCEAHDFEAQEGGQLSKDKALDALAELRKRITAGSGVWLEENKALLWDVGRALGFDDIDCAYIAGDLDELYRKAR